MSILEVKKKREDFYKSIENIKFEHPNEFELNGDVNEYEEKLLPCITGPCEQLYQAIAKEFGNHSQKSASRKYVEPIRTLVLYLKDIKEIDEAVYKKLLELKKACANAGNAKFGKLTFGATLDHKPTSQKFEDWCKDLGTLESRTRKFFETKIVLEKRK